MEEAVDGSRPPESFAVLACASSVSVVRADGAPRARCPHSVVLSELRRWQPAETKQLPLASSSSIVHGSSSLGSHLSRLRSYCPAGSGPFLSGGTASQRRWLLASNRRREG